MNKLLFWAVIIGLGVLAWKFWSAAKGRGTPRAARAPAPAPGQLPPSEAMLRCAHCGVYLPASDALRAGDRAYCSDEHRRLRDAAGPERRD